MKGNFKNKYDIIEIDYYSLGVFVRLDDEDEDLNGKLLGDRNFLKVVVLLFNEVLMRDILRIYNDYYFVKLMS